MTERKVLNKYYPPDFDPSKIPKLKEPRNKTFEIRLMAPCNMRCTTCGEYIYKVRKFNARKEDVDDMDYLGLRIYRFYIKCTACVSEICFRTDPENTDYVIESGATRNFEALMRAQEQEERDDKAYQEELKNNPMKLLEERTQASKNEMELSEAIEELKELNRRKLAVDYSSMLQKYEDERQKAAVAEEAADEAFVKSVFSKEPGMSVKRIIEDEDEDSDEDKRRTKVVKTDQPTDLLTDGVENKKEKKEVWERSIGSISTKGKGLAGLVKKKTPLVKKKSQEPEKTETKTNAEANSRNVGGNAGGSGNVGGKAGGSGNVGGKAGGSGNPQAGSSGLGLLGAYSDSSSNSD